MLIAFHLIFALHTAYLMCGYSLQGFISLYFTSWNFHPLLRIVFENKSCYLDRKMFELQNSNEIWVRSYLEILILKYNEEGSQGKYFRRNNHHCLKLLLVDKMLSAHSVCLFVFSSFHPIICLSLFFFTFLLSLLSFLLLSTCVSCLNFYHLLEKSVLHSPTSLIRWYIFAHFTLFVCKPSQL